MKKMEEKIKEKIEGKKVLNLEKTDNEIKLLLDDGSTLLMQVVYRDAIGAEHELFLIEQNFSIEDAQQEICADEKQIAEMTEELNMKKKLLEIAQKNINAEKGKRILGEGHKKHRKPKRKIHIPERAKEIAKRLGVLEQIVADLPKKRHMSFPEGKDTWVFDLRTHPATKKLTVYVMEKKRGN